MPSSEVSSVVMDMVRRYGLRWVVRCMVYGVDSATRSCQSLTYPVLRRPNRPLSLLQLLLIHRPRNYSSQPVPQRS